MVSLTALGIAVSVGAKRSRQAIARTYGWAAIYLLLSGCSWLLLLPAGGWTRYSSVTHFVEWFNIGNPFSVIVKLYLAVSKGAELDSLLPEALGWYAGFHGILCFVWLTWAARRLRRSAVGAELSRSEPGDASADRGSSAPASHAPRRRWKRPKMSDRPMLWKELWAEPGVRPGKWGRIILGAFVPVSFLPVALILYFEAIAEDGWKHVADGINLWVRVMGSIVACLMLVGVGLRAAGSISGECERHTLDDLLATPLSVASILRAKWLAAIFVSRWSWIWLGLIWASAVVMRGLSPWTLPWLLGAWLLTAAFFASIGLWISTWAASTQRAIQWMLVAFGIVAVGQWLLWLIATPVAVRSGISDRALDGIMELQATGLTPPLTFFLLAAPSTEVSLWPAADWFNFRHMAVQGWYFWALGSLMFWAMAVVSFRRSIDRPAEMGEHDRIGYWLGPSREGHCPVLRRLAMPVAAIVGYVLLGVYWSFTTHGSQERLDEAIAEADRLDPGWRLEELEAKRRQLSDAENSAYQVPAIAPYTGWPRRPWHPGVQWPSSNDLDERLHATPPNRKLAPDVFKTLTAELQAIQPVVLQSRLLKDYPRGRAPIEYRPDGLTTRLPWVQRSREIGEVLKYDALACSQRGEIDQALEDCIAALNSGRTTVDEPTAVSQVANISCQGIALSSIQTALAHGSASPAVVDRLQERLELECGDSPYLVASRGERAMCDRAFTYITAHPSARLPFSSGFYVWRLPMAERIVVFLGLDLASDRASYLHAMNRLVEVAKGPPERWHAQLAKLQRPLDVTRMAGNLLGGPDPWIMNRGTDAFRQRMAQLRCMTLLVAIERYRLKTTHWPPQLNDVVPAFVASIPIDPYDGKPLRYRIIPEGAVVYAVGPDLEDNGGRIRPQFKRQDAPGTDVGFKLWNPKLRHLPPAPVAGKPAK
jgi:ABC-type transport system involved in multi-copper enzyme maturation permease subunit